MAPTFEDLQDSLTGDHEKGLPGVVLATFTREGLEYSRARGKRQLGSEEEIAMNSTFLGFSLTKLLTTACALQCVDRGLIGLDDEVKKWLPELAAPDIISAEGDSFKLTPAGNSITLRHLLTHTSGISYDAMQPLLLDWRKQRGEPPLVMSGKVIEAYSLPLMFEPGTSWVYGAGLDWAGILVERLNGNIRISQYMEENLFQPLGMQSSGFHRETRLALGDKLIEMTTRTPTGSLVPMKSPYPENPRDASGGMGIITSTDDFIKVLIDFIQDEPRILKKESIELMFSPQFTIGNPQYQGLMAQGSLHNHLTGDCSGHSPIVFGLGGLLTQESTPNLPKNTLSWNGMPNIGWAINRERGYGAIYTSQILPPADPKSVQLLEAFWRDVWKQSTSQI